jgi:PEP-CTERM motif
MIKRKDLCKGLASGLLLLAASSAYAVPVTYNFSITGTVDVLGTQTVTITQSGAVNSTSTSTTTVANAYGLNVGDTITAYGSFTADLGPTVSGTVAFDLASFNATGNTLTIDMNGAQAGGTLLYASDDSVYSGGWPYMTFVNGVLTDFDYLKTTTPKFNSSFTYFDDMTSASFSSTVDNGLNGKNKITTVTTTTIQSMFGHWGQAVVTPVPEASTYAMMLTGLGLVGFMGAARRKSLRIAV